jgi:soluble lytic murein transglycosylase-like protein
MLEDARMPAQHRRPFAHVAAAFLGLGALALIPGEASADIYTYTDSQGVVHFSNKARGDGHYKLSFKSPDKKKPTIASVRFDESDPREMKGERFNRYNEWIRQASILYQIPEALIRAIIKCESDFDPRAISHAGAQGLMQMIPATALRMQVRDPFDPREAIFGGTRYLRVLANMFNGNLELTIAGYNAGEGAVVRYAGIPPYEETQNYVVHVLQYYRRYRAMNDSPAASHTTSASPRLAPTPQ